MARLQRLGGGDPADARGSDSMSPRLNVERFESAPNRYALIEAAWHLELISGRVSTSTRIKQERGNDKAYGLATVPSPDGLCMAEVAESSSYLNRSLRSVALIVMP
jgi:hypothetical protein